MEGRVAKRQCERPIAVSLKLHPIKLEKSRIERSLNEAVKICRVDEDESGYAQWIAIIKLLSHN